jgi:hypothetical protein
MRHIPEEELHAYLDQGLSRTQCVEIESHLADCAACSAARDQIAALRDRTTALLARLAPPRQVPPAFESLRREAAERASERRRRIHLGTWAASLVAAVALGWTASSMVSPPAETQVARREAPVPAIAQTPVRTPPAAPAEPRAVAVSTARPKDDKPLSPAKTTRAAAARRDETRRQTDSARAAILAVLDPAPAVELTQRDRSSARRVGELEGMWRTVSLDGARAEAGERLPQIDGLPVLGIQVQPGQQGRRPVMVVAQQLASGQVIQTIEGPASDVSQLLARRAMTNVDSTILRDGDSTGGGSRTDHAMAMQLGDRMLAITGALPSDSLRAMIRRLNAEMRSK